ncbi:MAG: DegT/DnrJ/EryC1/StrS family aminotransferase [Candidatus Helarchaeales archaeon]
MIHQAKPYIDERIASIAARTLLNDMLIEGETVRKFEREFARKFGFKHAVACKSGTDALKISLMVLKHMKYRKSDRLKVGVPAMTYISTADAATMTGNDVIIFDVDDERLLIDVNSRKEDLDVIIPVHLYGQPVNLDDVLPRAKFIIEDCAQAHGTEGIGHPESEFACFSFYPTKNMHVGGDGGMICFNDDEYVEAIRLFKNQARDASVRYFHWFVADHSRMNSVNAAIGLCQLEMLDEMVEHRRWIANLYYNNIDVKSKMKFDLRCSYHQYYIRHQKRDFLMEELLKRGIQTGIHYPIPINKQPSYLDQPDCPVAEKAADELISLPIWYKMDTDDVKKVIYWVNALA